MDEEDRKDIIKKVETSGQGDKQDVDVDVNVDGGDKVDVDTNDGGEVEEDAGAIIVNDFNLDREKERRPFPSENDDEEDFEKYSRGVEYGIQSEATDKDKMNLINKFNPALVKIGKKVGQDSDSYRRFSAAITNGDEAFARKMLRDLGIVQENLEKNSNNTLDNSKKTITFVDELRKKLKEHHNMNYTDYLNVDNQEYVDTETKPVETPVITPTETPTRTPRRNKPFKVPVIKPGTEPRPKASN